MGYWKTIEKIKCSEKVTNEILESIREKSTLLNNILHRKAIWIGHILRRYYLLHDSIEEQIPEVKGIKIKRTTPGRFGKQNYILGAKGES